ncbi:MAG: DUF1559 domain-containing protein [Planctomycetota bacterium]
MIRRGHTLLELIIVMMIVGMGMVIFIPQILRSRGEFRLAGCAMKQSRLAKAVLMYENVNGHLPVGGIADSKFCISRNLFGSCYDQYAGKRYSWVALVLPQLNLGDTFDRIDFNETAFESGGVGESLTELICPDDSIGAKGFAFVTSQRTTVFGLGNYAGFMTPSYLDFELYHPGALGGFDPGTTVGQRLAQIVDGSSRTLLLSEVRRRPDYSHPEDFGLSAYSAFGTNVGTTGDPRGAWALGWQGAAIISAGYLSVEDASCPDHFRNPWTPRPNTPAEWVLRPNTNCDGCHNDELVRCPRPLDADRRGMPCWRYTSPFAGAAAPRSLHDGGVNAAFVDGRVEFVSNDIDALVYAQSIGVEDAGPAFRPRRQKSLR